MAAAMAGSCRATAAGTVWSSPFMVRAISRVGSWSISASSGRKASVVRVASWARSSEYVEAEADTCGSRYGGVVGAGALRVRVRVSQRVRGECRWARAS